MQPRKCPGQDKRSWKPNDISEEPCLFCGASIEFWKDEARRRCENCGQITHNPRFDMACAEWCSFAKDCAGSPGPAGREAATCAVLIREMRSIFGEDHCRIRHALRVLSFAERMLDAEKAATDPLVVMAASVLHDIGIREAERKYGSSAGQYQELEGPPIARRILGRAGVDRERTDHICHIIADHHSAKNMRSPEFWILWDADHLVNLFVESEHRPAGDVNGLIRRAFKTASGRQLAGELAQAAG